MKKCYINHIIDVYFNENRVLDSDSMFLTIFYDKSTVEVLGTLLIELNKSINYSEGMDLAVNVQWKLIVYSVNYISKSFLGVNFWFV